VLIVVSYDIPNDRRRARLAHALKNFGARVQLSVFECLLENEELERLRVKLSHLTDPEEDSVRIYRLCETCRARVEIQGRGERSEDPEVYVL
jgi:CRISPR-associated protein Cas2